jgi:ribose/xylose/arabinose/galactoside ABC-type transport system permease subunit
MFWTTDPITLAVRRRSWIETRQIGKTRFILTRGVLLFGGFMFLANTVCGYFLQGIRHPFSPTKMLIAAIVYPLVGLLSGTITWSQNERLLATQQEDR